MMGWGIVRNGEKMGGELSKVEKRLDNCPVAKMTGGELF